MTNKLTSVDMAKAISRHCHNLSPAKLVKITIVKKPMIISHILSKKLPI